jgi:hypothetical protein
MRSISMVIRQVKKFTFLLNIFLTFSKPNMPVKHKITSSLQVLSASLRTA